MSSYEFQKPLDYELNCAESGYAIVCDGDTAPKAISSGQYLFIKNHSTLATGGYHATAAIASGADLTSSNTAPDADGIANALNSNITTINNNIANPFPNTKISNTSIYNTTKTYANNTGHICLLVLEYTLYTANKSVSISLSSIGQVFKDNKSGTNEIIERTISVIVPNGVTATIAYGETGYTGNYRVFGI